MFSLNYLAVRKSGCASHIVPRIALGCIFDIIREPSGMLLNIKIHLTNFPLLEKVGYYARLYPYSAEDSDYR